MFKNSLRERDTCASTGCVSKKQKRQARKSHSKLNYQDLEPRNLLASVVGESLFYDNSFWDGNIAGPSVSDSAAIATDKSSFANGEAATYDNYSNYREGINGILVDVEDAMAELTEGDFEFRVGKTDDTSTWSVATSPLSVTSQGVPGQDGVSRVTLVWADRAIMNTWLQVTVLANDSTGLTEDHVFYFGNVVAEVGDDPDNTRVNLVDVGRTRVNQTGFVGATIDNVYDFNKDGRVNLVDVGTVRVNQSGFFPLRLITPHEGQSLVADQSDGRSMVNSIDTSSSFDSVRNSSLVASAERLKFSESAGRMNRAALDGSIERIEQKAESFSESDAAKMSNAKRDDFFGLMALESGSVELFE